MELPKLRLQKVLNFWPYGVNLPESQKRPSEPYYERIMIDTYLIRPVRASDAVDLLELVKSSSGGLSSLQPRLDFVRDYIASAEKSFSGKLAIDEPHKYLMGMVDIASGRLIGCAAVKTCVGVSEPFINFDLKGDAPDQFLEASSRFRGATEVGSLFLHKDFRAGGLGRYLAKVRYLLMMTEPWRFGDTVIAELRGICGKNGSPLYDFMFQDRLEKTFLEADTEYFDRNPEALGDIVPIGHIPTAGMPVGVRASIAQPHASGRAAMRLLQSEGFIFSGTIDLFDGGPIMSVYRDTIRTGMESRLGTVSAGCEDGDVMLVSAGQVNDFRAVVTAGRLSETGAQISAAALKALDCKTGDTVRYWQKDPKTVRAKASSLVKAHA